MTIFGNVYKTVKGKKPNQLVESESGELAPYLSASYFRTGVARQWVNPSDKNYVRVEPKDVVILWDGSNSGDVFTGLQGALSSTMARLNGNGSYHDKFTYYFLKTQFQKLNSQTTGSTIPHVNGAVLKNLILPSYDKDAQHKIAAYLDTVQNSIMQQRKVVAKLQELKKSMMRHLFTYGTRNEKTKQTEIGRIPSSWGIVAMGSLGKIGNGSTPKKDNMAYWHQGSVPWLTSAKIHDAVIRSPERYVTPLAMKECHLPLVRAGSLLIAITGQGKTLGNSAIVEFDTCVSQHLAYLDFQDKGMEPHFLRYYLNSRYAELRRLGGGGGSTKGALTCSILKTYSVALPPLDEQKTIVAILTTIDKVIELHEAKRNMLANFFDNLLQQLMTGKIEIA